MCEASSAIKLIIAGLAAFMGCVLISMGFIFRREHILLSYMVVSAEVPTPTLSVILIGILILILSVLNLIPSVQNTVMGRLIYCFFTITLVLYFVIVTVILLNERQTLIYQAELVVGRVWENEDKLTLDTLSHKFHCCGKMYYTDYGEKDLPASCCEFTIENQCPVINAYKRGCQEKFKDYVNTRIDWISYIAITSALILSILLLDTHIGSNRRF